MKNLTKIIFIFVIILITCKPKEAEKNISMNMVGNDKDSHGCIGSAGYQWSEVLQDCIRIFELPLTLTSLSGEQIAGVAFSKDMEKAEVMSSIGNFILQKKADSSYSFESPDISKFLNLKNGKWEFGDSKTNKVEYRQQ